MAERRQADRAPRIVAVRPRRPGVAPSPTGAANRGTDPAGAARLPAIGRAPAEGPPEARCGPRSHRSSAGRVGGDRISPTWLAAWRTSPADRRAEIGECSVFIYRIRCRRSFTVCGRMVRVSRFGGLRPRGNAPDRGGPRGALCPFIPQILTTVTPGNRAGRVGRGDTIAGAPGRCHHRRRMGRIAGVSGSRWRGRVPGWHRDRRTEISVTPRTSPSGRPSGHADPAGRLGL
jgi:hypothetical protein